VLANTKNNNSKSFATNKFHKSNQPKSDKDCALGVHTASKMLLKRIFNTIGATKIMCWLIALQAYQSLK
jgi:hypothetical protein